MKAFIIFLCLGCMGVLHAQVGDPSYIYHFKKYFADSARCVITMERDSVDGFEVRHVTTVTPSYHVARIPRGDDFEPIVIFEITSLSVQTDAEGMEGHIVLSARKEERGTFQTIWTKKIDAHLMNYPDDYLESTTYGCCGADDGRELFRYTDGATILFLTSALNRIRIPNTRLERYAGLLSESSTRNYSDIQDTMMCAVLTYVDPATLKKQRVIIDYKNVAAFDSLGDNAIGEITLAPLLHKDSENYDRPGDLSLWTEDGNSDPAGFSDFTIDLHVYGRKDLTISIPVEHDKIRIDGIRSDFFDVSLR
ncbi:MAG: hypothetical protein ACHQM6_07675 [Candidatus Kapaibacterium sp.]